MRIAIVSDLAHPHKGGGEVYVMQLSKKLVSLGHEVHWLTSRIPGTVESETIEGINVHRIPILFERRYIFPGRQTFPFTALLHKVDFLHNVDLVQANTMVAGLTGWRIAKNYGKPSLLFCHEFFGDLWKRIGQNIAERHLYPEFERRIARSPYDWFATPSEYSKMTLIKAGAPRARITVIPHGVDRSVYNRGIDGKAMKKELGLESFRLFGYIGRLRIGGTTQSKNIPALIEIAKIVSQYGSA